MSALCRGDTLGAASIDQGIPTSTLPKSETETCPDDAPCLLPAVVEQSQNFDYTALDQCVADEVRAAAIDIHDQLRKGCAAYIAIGDILISTTVADRLRP